MANKKGNITTSEALTMEEFKKLLDRLRNDGLFIWELYCRISFYTGFRVSDVLSTTWNDILSHEYLDKVEKKTKKVRTIMFNDFQKKKILELYILLGEPDKSLPVICNPETKKAYTKDYINRKLKFFRSKYGIKLRNFSTHTLRKTLGNYVYEQHGRNADGAMAVMKMFNHSNLGTTLTYLGVTQRKINNILESINI